MVYRMFSVDIESFICHYYNYFGFHYSYNKGQTEAKTTTSFWWGKTEGRAVHQSSCFHFYYCWGMAVQSVNTLPTLPWVVYVWSHANSHEYEWKGCELLLAFKEAGACPCFLSPSTSRLRCPVWYTRHDKVARWENFVLGIIAWRLATLDYCEQEISIFYIWASMYLEIYLLPQLTLSWLIQCWWTKAVLCKEWSNKVRKLILVRENLTIEIESKN